MPEIEKFDPSSIKEKIEEKIKDMVTDLIPDDAWKQMVSTEVDRFFGPIPDRSYRSTDKDKVAKEILREIIEAHYRAAVKVELEKPEYLGESQWITPPGAEMGHEVFEPSAMVKQMVKDNLEEIVKLAITQIMGNTIQAAIETIKQQMIRMQ